MASDAKQREVTVVRQLTKFEPGWKRHTLGAWFSVENPQNTPGEYLTVMPQPPGTCPVLLVKRTPEGLVMSVLPGTYMDRPHVGVRIVVSGDHAGMNQVYSIGLKRWATATAPIFVGCMLSPGDMKQRGATFAKRNPGTPFTLRAHVAIGYLTDLTSETVTVELVHSILGLDPVTVIKYPPAPPAKPDTARLTAIMEDGKLHGDIVFMVGTPPAPVRAFSAFLRQATSVNLTARGFSEDSSKEIPLPLMSLEVFHVWLSFVYLNDISDKDLATHALHLLPHAHLYLMDTLMHKCVEYLCFMLKVSPRKPTHAHARPRTPTQAH